MAGKITAMGGTLDVNSIVSQLMSVERAPLAKLQKEQVGINTKLSAWGTVKSALSELQTAADKLTKQDTWRSTTATSSNEDQVQVSGGSAKSGATGNYSILVKTLAQSQTVTTAGFAAEDAKLGSGTLRIQLGTVNADGTQFNPDANRKALEISIPENATVKDVRDIINRSNAGVNANLIHDGNSVRIMLTGSKTGADSAFEITTSGNGLEALATKAVKGGHGNGSQLTQIATNANIEVNGLAVSASTNKINDMIDGVTLNLKKVDKSPVNVSVETNKDSLKEDIEGFVKAYNKVNSLIAEQTKYDPATKTAGTLQGNATLVRIHQQVRALVRAQEDGSGLSGAGFELDRNGALSIKESRLNDLLNNPDKLRNLFSGEGSLTPGSLVKREASPAGSSPPAGTPNAATPSPSSSSHGGATPGSPLAHHEGVARQLSERLREILDSDGSLNGTTKALRRSLDASTSRIDRMNEKLERTEDRLLKQYAALDANLSKITGSFSSIAALLK